MKFYAENKVNPFASCLPLVAQLPFFIGALLPAAERPAAATSAARPSRPCGEDVPCAQVPGAIHGAGAVPLHPRPHGQGDGRGARRS